MLKSTYSLFRTRSTADSAAPSTHGVAASGTNTYYSDVWQAEDDFGLTVVTSGTLTGTWTLWCTDNINADPATDVDWVDSSAEPEFIETNPAAGATKWRVNAVLLRAAKCRLKYVNASGTGVLAAYVAV